jgi:hypothetical protein
MAYIIIDGENKKPSFPVVCFHGAEIPGVSDGEEERAAAGSFGPDRNAVFSGLSHVGGSIRI